MRLVKCHKVKVAVFLLFLLNLILGLLFINEGLFHYDGVVLARALEQTLQTGHLQAAVRGRYGAVIINSVIYSPFFILHHNADFAVRFSSVLFGALSIVVLFLFVWELFGDFPQAVFAALFLSFTPFYFSPNTYGKEHGMSMFFLLSAFYLVCRGVNKKSVFLIAISSFLFAVAVSVREAIFVSLPLYVLLYLCPEISLAPFKIRIDKARFSLRWMAALCLPFLVTFNIIFFSYLNTEFYREIAMQEGDYAKFLGFFSYNLKTAFKDLYKSIPWLLFLFSTLGLFSMLKKKNIFKAFFLCLWFMLIFYFGNVTLYKPRYLDIVIVPVYILAAYALAGLYTKDRLIAVTIGAYLVLQMFIFMYPMLAFRHRYNGEKQFALFVKANTEDNAIILAMDDAVFIEYYAQRKTLIHPKFGYKQMHEFLRRVANYLVNKVPVYLASSGLSYDQEQRFRNVLLTNFDLKIVGSKLSEDYHQPELGFAKYDQTLFKLDYKFKPEADSSGLNKH